MKTHKESELESPHRKASVALRGLDLFSVVLWFSFQATSWWKLILNDHFSAPTFALALVVSWLLADLVSGIAHYLADNYGSPKTPFFGPAFIRPFRHHHQSPLSLLDHGFLERNGNNALIASCVIFWIPFSSLQSQMSVFCAATLGLLSIWSAATNQIHAWAHQAVAPWPVALLQRAGILLSREHHAIHHAPYEGIDPEKVDQVTSTAYCITSGFWDRVVTSRARRAPASPNPVPQAEAPRGT